MVEAEVDAEVGEGGYGVGHEAFAAGFVDGRAHAVGDFYGEAVLGGGDGAGEAGWASAGDEDVGGGCVLLMRRVESLLGLIGRVFKKRLC